MVGGRQQAVGIIRKIIYQITCRLRKRMLQQEIHSFLNISIEGTQLGPSTSASKSWNILCTQHKFRGAATAKPCKHKVARLQLQFCQHHLESNSVTKRTIDPERLFEVFSRNLAENCLQKSSDGLVFDRNVLGPTVRGQPRSLRLADKYNSIQIGEARLLSP